MEFKVKGKIVDLEFTFNSFRYMEDVDMSVTAEFDKKPFKLIRFTEDLLFGALNCDPNKKVTKEVASKALDDYIKNGGSFLELYNGLVKLLEEADFFKGLQEETEK